MILPLFAHQGVLLFTHFLRAYARVCTLIRPAISDVALELYTVLWFISTKEAASDVVGSE